VRTVVHLKHAADDRWVAVEAGFPVLVAQHQDGGRAGLVVAFDEGAAILRTDAQHVEEVRRHDSGRDPLRLRPPEQDEPHGVEFDEAVKARCLAVIAHFLW
jgi:hypothetical protein